MVSGQYGSRAWPAKDDSQRAASDITMRDTVAFIATSGSPHGIGRTDDIEHPLGLVGICLRFIVELLAHAIDVERALPLRHNDGRNTIADQVGERARLRHEAVDPQN